MSATSAILQVRSESRQAGSAQLRTFHTSEMLTQMMDADHCWGLSNPGPNTLYVWLEPWADEIEVPVRSTITFNPSGGHDDCPLGQVEWTTDHLVVWATAQRIAVYVDGVLQHSGSAVIPVPDGLTKGMLGIVFADQPAARLGGAPSDPIGRTSWWQLIRRCLGL